jgi:hypothetical protein
MDDAPFTHNLSLLLGSDRQEYLRLLALRSAMEANHGEGIAYFEDTCDDLRVVAERIAQTVVKHACPAEYNRASWVLTLTPEAAS